VQHPRALRKKEGNRQSAEHHFPSHSVTLNDIVKEGEGEKKGTIDALFPGGGGKIGRQRDPLISFNDQIDRFKKGKREKEEKVPAHRPTMADVARRKGSESDQRALTL